MAYFEALCPPLTSSKDMGRKNHDPEFMWEVFGEEGSVITAFPTPSDANHRWYAIQAGSPHVDPRNPESIHWQMAPRRLSPDGQFPQIEDLSVPEVSVYTEALTTFLHENPAGVSFYNIGRDRDTLSAMSWPQLHAHFETGLDPSSYVALEDRPDSFEASYQKAVRRHPDLAQSFFTQTLSADEEISANAAVIDIRTADETRDDLACPHFGEYPTGGSFMILREGADPLEIASLIKRTNEIMLDTHDEYTQQVRAADGAHDDAPGYPTSPTYTGLFAKLQSGELAFGLFSNTQHNGNRVGGAEALGMFPDRRYDDSISLEDLFYRNIRSANQLAQSPSEVSLPDGSFVAAAGGA